VEPRFSTADNVTEHATSDLPDLLTRPDGMVWLDIPNWDEHAEQLCEGCFTRRHPSQFPDPTVNIAGEA
jgi:hypothetical protein